jgi:hypothetical protein
VFAVAQLPLIEPCCGVHEKLRKDTGLEGAALHLRPANA